MKYFIVFALIAATASAASFVKPTGVSGDLAQVQEIIDAINSPNTDPATAALLQDLLMETLGIKPEYEPVAVGPAIVDIAHPIGGGAEIIDFPTPDNGALTIVDQPAAVVHPAGVAPIVEASPDVALPLVQIILNINAGSAAAAAAVPELVVVPEVEPVLVADSASPAEPILVVDNFPTLPVIPEPVLVAEPVQVVDSAPAPVVVAPVVVLPEELN